MAAAEGYFPRGRSVLRMVHGERAVGRLYGQRALLVQATQPLAFAGLMANTSGTPAPFQRLAHTAVTMETVFFGSKDDADRETRRVRELHSRVRGEIDRPAGRWPAGSGYSADAPELLLWILACLADSAEAAYAKCVRALRPEECEEFWRDYLLVGELFGLQRSEAPATYPDYRDYMAERLASDDLHVLPEAHEIGTRVAFELPLPADRRWALPAVNLLVVGLLPERVRELYGLRWSAAHQASFEALTAFVRGTRPVVPRRLRRGRTAPEYELVARVERKRLARERARLVA
jgi:uncharacterized protein (DUF2236 family)